MGEESREQASWERLPGESLTWFRRFEQFRLMVPVRTVAAVYHQEASVKPRKNASNGSGKVPGDWYEIAKQWQWEERAAAWDAYETARVEAIITHEREKALRAGLALMHKRVEALAAIAHQLEDYMGDKSRVWLADVKIVATGMGQSERVDLEVFNHELFKEYREYLDDIAEEVGGRVKKQEVNNKGNPLSQVNVHVFLPD